MKIVMVASECNPLCKTGGLADVVFSLSRELVRQGHDVFVFLPFYKKVKDKKINSTFLGYDFLDMSWRHQYIGTSKIVIDGINFYLIENDQYFGRDNLYGYDDDGERFAFFSLATQKLINDLKIKPDIVHVHDWQAGMLPVLMKNKPLNKDKSKYVLTIHNPAFKGYLDKYALGNLYNLDSSIFDDGSCRLDDMVSTLKAAISYCDKITTVSPTHREELLSSYSSQGLAGVLEFRKDDFCGIINGIDDVEFDPKNDKRIAKNYSKSAFKTGKKACKNDLLKHFGLENLDAPTFGLVSRLTWQKGISLIFDNIDYLVARGANLIFLGSGEREIEEKLEYYRNIYPKNIAVYIGYNDDLAHKVYAGSDFFLMPSLFEPCGIGQIIAQRYGALPIVRETGGLKDTVHAEIDGFSFADFESYSMSCTLVRALEVYYADKDLLNKMISTALSLDRSWKDSAKIYLGIYKELLDK